MDRQTAGELAHVMNTLAGAHVKHVTAHIKQSPTDGSGRFTAIVSTFGPPPDLQGDVIAPGAFLLSIADWRDRGKRPAIWWQHEYGNPAASIGTVEKMFETDEGLIIEGILDLDHEPAVAVYEGLLSGRLSEFSIGFSTIREHRESGYNVLDEVELLEVSVVHAGANRNTRVLEVKTNAVTAGSNATSRWTSQISIDSNDATLWNRRIDEAASRRAPVNEETMAAVDELLTEVKLEKVNEALARAEQAAWEQRMLVNLVLDAAPVRVDARMRPDH